MLEFTHPEEKKTLFDPFAITYKGERIEVTLITVDCYNALNAFSEKIVDAKLAITFGEALIGKARFKELGDPSVLELQQIGIWMLKTFIEPLFKVEGQAGEPKNEAPV
jgi:hypothetical protein